MSPVWVGQLEEATAQKYAAQESLKGICMVRGQRDRVQSKWCLEGAKEDFFFFINLPTANSALLTSNWASPLLDLNTYKSHKVMY